MQLPAPIEAPAEPSLRTRARLAAGRSAELLSCSAARSGCAGARRDGAAARSQGARAAAAAQKTSGRPVRADGLKAEAWRYIQSRRVLLCQMQSSDGKSTRGYLNSLARIWGVSLPFLKFRNQFWRARDRRASAEKHPLPLLTPQGRGSPARSPPSHPSPLPSNGA